jgi:hypothetical protein
MNNQLVFSVRPLDSDPHQVLVTVVAPDQAQIQVSMNLTEIANFLHTLGTQSLQVAEHYRELATHENSPQEKPVFH